MTSNPTSNQKTEAIVSRSLWRHAFKKIQWRKVMYFLFVISFVSLVASFVINDFLLMMWAVSYFIIMLIFLVCDAAIEEYQVRKESKELLKP